MRAKRWLLQKKPSGNKTNKKASDSRLSEECVTYFKNNPNALIIRYFGLALYYVNNSVSMRNLLRHKSNEGAVEHWDLIQEADIGLWEALKSYDSKKGGYTTHAWWTIRARLQIFEPQIESVYLPRFVYEYVARNFFSGSGFDENVILRELKINPPTEDEFNKKLFLDALCVYLGTFIYLDSSPDQANDIFTHDPIQEKKIDALVANELIIDEEDPWKNINLLVKDLEFYIDPSEEFLPEEILDTYYIDEEKLGKIRLLKKILGKPDLLTKREKLVLSLRYGPDEITYEDIGKIITGKKIRRNKGKNEPLGRQAVQYIEKRALQKIRLFIKDLEKN